MQNPILTAAQAQAVYSAMCALNNAGNTTGNVIIPKAEGQIDEPRVVWSSAGVAVRFSSTFQVEHYADQAAFAAAYGYTYQDYTARLRAILEAAAPAVVLKLSQHIGATLIDGEPVWFNLNDCVENHFDFDRSAWNDANGCWDGETLAGTWGALERAEFAGIQAAFQAGREAIPVAAHRLASSAASHDRVSEVRREAVANANVHLSNAGLPTIRELSRAISAGPSQVVGFEPHGQRQGDFAFGWKTAMERVWNAMEGTVVTQRCIDNAEA